MAAPASHSTKTPDSLTSRVITEANRTAPDASFQVILAGTLIARRWDRWLVLETSCSATVYSRVRDVQLNAMPRTIQVPRRSCATLYSGHLRGTLCVMRAHERTIVANINRGVVVSRYTAEQQIGYLVAISDPFSRPRRRNFK